MPFRCDIPPFPSNRPVFSIVLANTLLSTIPGISGAGPTPQRTVFTPNLDAELVLNGVITSQPHRPNTPTGCPTPATITRAMMVLTGLTPLFVNAGLLHPPVIPCLDVYGSPGKDPRETDAVPMAEILYRRGTWIGQFLSSRNDLLVLGECVPGGTTTALCILRSMGYRASVSSSFTSNPLHLKDEVCTTVVNRIKRENLLMPLDLVRCGGDPMIAVAAGMVAGFGGPTILAGGTQMLAVAAVCTALGYSPPPIATTIYVKDDPSASFEKTAAEVGVSAYFIDPDFGALGHKGLARYCLGEVKEGMGAGGAMILARMLGHSPECIRQQIFQVVEEFS